MPLDTVVKGVKVDYPALVPAYVPSTEHPAQFPPGGLLVETDTKDILRNTGTLNSPSFISIVTAAAQDAGATQKGVTKLSVAPASPTNPIALGQNDPILASISSHMSNLSNPHGVTPGQIGAALDTAFQTHANDRTKHVNLGTTAQRTGSSPVADMTWLDTDEGRWYWYEAGVWETAPSAPAVSYDDLTDVPSTFTPSLHKASHALGAADELLPADIGAVPTTRLVSTASGQLSGGGDLSGNRTLGLATVPTLTPGTYGIGGGSATVDAYGRVTAITAGTTSGVPLATATQEGVVKLSRTPDPGEGEDHVALLFADYAPGITTSRQVLTTSPLSGGGDLSADRNISLNALGITNAHIANNTIEVTKLQPGGSFIRSVADVTARNALGAIREGQVVHVRTNDTSYQSNSADNTDAASVTWTPMGGIGSAFHYQAFDFNGALANTRISDQVPVGAWTIRRVWVRGRTAPSGANAIFEIRKGASGAANGTLITGGTLTVTAGNRELQLTDRNVACTLNDFVEVACTQAGSSVAGSDFIVLIEFQVA